MNPHEIINIATLVALTIAVFYLGYIAGGKNTREGVASGEIKMFLVEFKDKTRQWCTEKELSRFNDSDILNKYELKIMVQS